MDINSWLKHTRRDPRRALVAAAAGTTIKYIGMVGRGERVGSTGFHKSLHAASIQHTPEHVMTLAELRPEVWGAPFDEKNIPLQEDKNHVQPQTPTKTAGQRGAAVA